LIIINRQWPIRKTGERRPVFKRTLKGAVKKIKQSQAIKWLWVLFIVGSSISTMPRDAAGSQAYFINNQKVLLYKIINWWYDSLPEDAHRLCGALIRCRAKGPIQIEYNAGEMTLKFNANTEFAQLLSIFEPWEQGLGRSRLKLTWVNKEYFGNGKIRVSTTRPPSARSYVFSPVDRADARRILSVERFVGFQLEGVVKGLMNGKIALHHAGKQLKTCPKKFQRPHENDPTTLNIVNFQTREILATLSVVFDH